MDVPQQVLVTNITTSNTEGIAPLCIIYRIYYLYIFIPTISILFGF
nr:MAG TPA: hypothetical protein [Caudoviricetes sp.]